MKLKYIYRKWFLIMLMPCMCGVASGSSGSEFSVAPACRLAFADDVNSFSQQVTENRMPLLEQKDLFETYKKEKLGVNGRDDKTLIDVRRFLKKHPQSAKKLPAREYFITTDLVQYPLSAEFTQMIEKLRTLADELDNLLNIDQSNNLTFWQKILDFSPMRTIPTLKPYQIPQIQYSSLVAHLRAMTIDNKASTNTDTHQKKILYQDLDLYEKIIYVKEYYSLSRSNESPLVQNTLPGRAISTYRILNHIRDAMLQKGKNIKHISQAMVDLIYLSGLHTLYGRLLINSSSQVEQMLAIENMLKMKEKVAIYLGFKDGFKQLQNALKVSKPLELTKYERAMIENSKGLPHIQELSVGEPAIYRVRAMSVEEAPWTSALAEKPLTSDYFYNSLDPNRLFFTLTDTHLKSSGYISVVLGTTRKPILNKTMKTAIINEVQNIPISMIAPMLKIIYLSLKEQEYILALPTTLPELETISDSLKISSYIQVEINSYLSNYIYYFKPNKYWGSVRGRMNKRRRSSSSLLQDRMDILREFDYNAIDTSGFKIEPGQIYLRDNSI